ncbi:MAG: hypothetical protein HWN67_21015 [Candidatus Helarchaeota archaeon]|nr:hypothetical protein [Candidatus Helarchaeota archaeon]
MINSAAEELLLISPWIYKDIILDSLTIARNRGVLVKIIVRKFKFDQDNINHLISIQKLDMNGIQITFTDNIHAKILIKDGKELLLSSKNMIDSNAIDMGIWNKVQSEAKRARNEFYLLYNQRFYDSNYIDFSSLNLNLDIFNIDFIMEIYGRKFGELFGGFEIAEHDGDKIFVSSRNVIFCIHPVVIKILEDLGIKYEVFSIDQLWRVKVDGQWYLICEYFGALDEKISNKARILLDNNEKTFLLWSTDNNEQYIAITDGRLALLIRNEKKFTVLK